MKACCLSTFPYVKFEWTQSLREVFKREKVPKVQKIAEPVGGAFLDTDLTWVSSSSPMEILLFPSSAHLISLYIQNCININIYQENFLFKTERTHIPRRAMFEATALKRRCTYGQST